MPELCSIDFDERGSALIARISGEIDISNAEAVEKLLATRLDTVEHYVVDLSATTHLDSAAIRLLFNLGERLRTRGRSLTLVVPETSPVSRLLRISDIGAVIELSADLDEVIERQRSDASGIGSD